MPWSRAIEMTASMSVTMVTTIAARWAASAAVSATSAPRLARSRVGAGLRFQTIVRMPARNALVAIPWPMAPMPSTATGSCVDSIAPPAGCLGGLDSPPDSRPAPGGSRRRVATDRDPNLAARFCRVTVGVPRVPVDLGCDEGLTTSSHQKLDRPAIIETALPAPVTAPSSTVSIVTASRTRSRRRCRYKRGTRDGQQVLKGQRRPAAHAIATAVEPGLGGNTGLWATRARVTATPAFSSRLRGASRAVVRRNSTAGAGGAGFK